MLVFFWFLGPNRNLFTLCVYHGGQFSADRLWVGGELIEFDSLEKNSIGLIWLLRFVSTALKRLPSFLFFGKNSGEQKLFLIREDCQFKSLLVDGKLTVYIVEGIEADALGLTGYVRVETQDGGAENLGDAVEYERERQRKGKAAVVEESLDGSGNDDEDSDYEGQSCDSGGEDDILFHKNIDEDVEWLGDESVQGEQVGGEKEKGRTENEDGEEDLNLSEDDFPTYNENGEEPKLPIYLGTQKFNPSFQLGMVFSTKQEFRELVDSHSILESRSVYFPKSDKSRIYARCNDEKCTFKINLRKRQFDNSFEITTLFPDHSCETDYHVKNMNSNWLKERYGYKWKGDKNRSVDGFREEIVHEVRCHVSWWQAYLCKKKALQTHLGDSAGQYGMLWSYASEIRKSNPNSTVLLSVDNVGDQNIFSKFYVCLGALKEGFLKACRPIFGVDGTFLKGPYGGILLTAVGIDPNNNLYPIAWAVVGKEDWANWHWFLSKLKADLDAERDHVWTIISDKQKGLIKAVGEVFPSAAHRFCVSHLHTNFLNAGFRGQAFKTALWRAAKASTVNDFGRRMQDIKKMDVKAFEWLKDKHPSHWSRSHFTSHPKCDVLLNNLCESFNACILECRELPILSMLESIMQKMMERLVDCRELGAIWKGPFCPRIQKVIDKIKAKIPDCKPYKSSDFHYQISCFDGTQFAVDLENWTCGCRRWDISGIPCKHAMSAITSQKLNVADYVHNCYRVETYREAYKPCILPMNGRDQWEPSEAIPPLPPKLVRQAGRPPKARRKEKDEQVQHRRKRTAGRPTPLDGHKKKRAQETLTCGRCGERGHNKRSCHRRENEQVVILYFNLCFSFLHFVA